MGCPQNTFAVAADPPVAEQDESVFGGILKGTNQRLGAAKKSLLKLFLKIATNGATDGTSAGTYPRDKGIPQNCQAYLKGTRQHVRQVLNRVNI